MSLDSTSSLHYNILCILSKMDVCVCIALVYLWKTYNDNDSLTCNGKSEEEKEKDGINIEHLLGLHCKYIEKTNANQINKTKPRRQFSDSTQTDNNSEPLIIIIHSPPTTDTTNKKQITLQFPIRHQL